MAGNPVFNDGVLWEESVSAVTATNTVELGARRVDGGADWVYVYNASTNEAIDTKRAAKLASASTSYSVDVAIAVPSTITAGVLAGVCVNATITTGYYGWLMTRGFCTVLNKASAAIAGAKFMLSESGTMTPYTTVSGTEWAIAGIFCSTVTAATTATQDVTAYIKSYWF